MTKHINLIADFNTDHLTYDPVTGLITNSKTGKTWIESNTSYGYIQINLNHRTDTNIVRPIKAHRIAYYLHYGTEPNIIDHQNGVRTDNRISNLISTTQKHNMQNKKRQSNSTLMVGVMKNTNGKYFSAMTISKRTGKTTSFGTYATEELAHLVSTYYKSIHFDNYKGADLADTLNGKTHPYKDGSLPNIVAGIYDTKGNSALTHLGK